MSKRSTRSTANTRRALGLADRLIGHHQVVPVSRAKRPVAGLGCMVLLLIAVALALTATRAPARQATSTVPCGLPHAAFCDQFSFPAATGNRSGELNGTVWGVSRQLGFNNIGQGQYAGAVRSLRMTGSCSPHLVTIESDIQICHGQLNDVVNDNPAITPANLTKQDDSGTVTSLAMYPKQPFDFRARTGTVVFDVSDDSGGMHAAWPEFWITNAPAPDPFAHLGSWRSLPQYGFGLRLGAACSAGQGAQCGPRCKNNNTGLVVTVDSLITSDNYVESDPDNSSDHSTLQTQRDGCVREPTKPGELNHFEIRVSENRISVYATNAGTTKPLIHLATIPNVHLGFTRGLIWLEDAHYNANKAVDTTLQAMHTFTWDNVAFDGPRLPRDLAFDAADTLTRITNYPALINLGWLSSAAAPAVITVPKVTGKAKARGGLLTFNFLNEDVAPLDISYSLNAHARHVLRWPYPDAIDNSPRTVAIPIPLSEVRNGTNRVRIWSAADDLILSNLDLIMRGAGG